MPRKKYWKISKARGIVTDRREIRQLRRQMEEYSSDMDSELITSKDTDGLNFPKKAENGLNVPKKAENGLNFPKKAENGLNFPKKAENGLNFPRKADSVAKKLCTDSVAKKLCTDSVAKTLCIDSFAKKLCTESVAKKPCTETVAKHFADSVTDTNPNICQFKHAVVDPTKLIENVSSKIQTDFDTVFLETFPDVDSDYQSKVIEKSFQRENITVFPKNTMHQQQTQHNENVTADNDPHSTLQSSSQGTLQSVIHNDFHSTPCMSVPDSESCSMSHSNYHSDLHIGSLSTPQSDSHRTLHGDSPSSFIGFKKQTSPLLWNAVQLMFGNFHQNDERFGDQSRGFQCTCNALCMLVHDKIQNSSDLDQVLYDGDALYNSTINRLKAEGKFVHSLLSLEEIPDTLENKCGHYFVEKEPIRCGVFVNAITDQDLPTLHDALETAFSKSTSVLLIIGAVCSAISKRNNLFVFFDSHSHGEDALSSSDGTSILMLFSCLEDLIAYLYAFYESMKIDMTVQFDLLPISIRKNDHSSSHELLGAYFYDQPLRQQQKAAISNNKKPILNEKTKKSRKEYYTGSFH